MAKQKVTLSAVGKVQLGEVFGCTMDCVGQKVAEGEQVTFGMIASCFVHCLIGCCAKTGSPPTDEDTEPNPGHDESPPAAPKPPAPPPPEAPRRR